jgi:hypothetical protein
MVCAQLTNQFSTERVHCIMIVLTIGHERMVKSYRIELVLAAG